MLAAALNPFQVKWVHKGTERGETLVSISTDGRVVEWSMKKGLTYSPLMTLKRIGARTQRRFQAQILMSFEAVGPGFRTSRSL